MKFTFNIEKKYLYFTLGFILIVGVAIFVAAQTVPNPGHSIGEVGCDPDAPNCVLLFSDSRITTTRHIGVSYVSDKLNIARTGVADDLVIDANGNVGIGTTAPETKLHIKGGRLGIQPASWSGDYWNIFHNADDRTTDYGLMFRRGLRGDNYLILGDNNGASSFPTGNVGIGTTNPVSKLVVGGGSANWNEITPGRTTGSIHLDPQSSGDNFGSAVTWGASDSDDGETAQAGIYVRSDGLYGTKMYFATTDAYVFGSKTRMFIDNTGNVGIGTTDPSAAKLVVAGTVKITGGNPGADKVLTSDADGLASWTTPASGGITGSGTTNYVPKWTSATALGNSLIFDDGTNVGIGATSPARKLDVIGDIRLTGTIRSSAATVNFLTDTGAARGAKVGSLVISNSYTNNAPANGLFVTGNVGIGTTGTPTAKLDVNGNVKVNGKIRTQDRDYGNYKIQTDSSLYVAGSAKVVGTMDANRLQIGNGDSTITGNTEFLGYVFMGSGTFFQLPSSNSPPQQCNGSNKGAMYLDTSQNGAQGIPCVCSYGVDQYASWKWRDIWFANECT